MKRSYKKYYIIAFSLVFVTGAFIGLWNLAEHRSKIEKSRTRKLPEGSPIMTLKGFKLEQTDGDKLDWVLSSEHADIYEKPNKHILFSQPRTVVYGDGLASNQYTINSKTGTYYIKDDKMDINEEVNIRTPKGFVFLTDNANYDFAHKKVRSDDPIKVNGVTDKGDGLFIEGVGLSGLVDTGNFNLSNKITAGMGENFSVKSNQADFNTRNNDVLFSGAVSAKKDNLNIKGNKLKLKYSGTAEPSDMEVKGNVLITIDDRKAICDNALIKAESNEVILTGKPELYAGKDIIVGEKIVFFTDNDEVYVSRVRASVSGKGVKKK